MRDCVCWNTCVGGEMERNETEYPFACVSWIEGSCCDERNESQIRERSGSIILTMKGIWLFWNTDA